MRRRWLLLIVVSLAYLFGGCAFPASGLSDQATLDRLSEAGSDLSQQHPFEFYLYHPEESGAQQLCSELSSQGFRVRIAKSEAGENWLCLASLTMPPTIGNLSEVADIFSQLIDQYGGEYDGWETIVMP